MARRKRPFARTRGGGTRWFAVGRGMSSGPWEHEHQAQHVVDLWNRAVELP